LLSATITYQSKAFEIDLEKPIDISIPVGRLQSPNAFYLPQPEYKTVEAGGFVGDVNRGGSCNVENIIFSPHGNGTHTECVGHISNEHSPVNKILTRHFFLAHLVTVSPEQINDESIISRNALSEVIPVNTNAAEALVIRTSPNNPEKLTSNYSGANPAFISAEAMRYINDLDIKHLLTDLPSVDKEDDNTLAAHHIFFGNNNDSFSNKTITEMIYAKDNIPDGLYWLDLQIAGFESDASPSKPILYKTRLV